MHHILALVQSWYLRQGVEILVSQQLKPEKATNMIAL
jgi:hypothetical protein